MKKVVALFCFALLISSLCGCADNDSVSSQQSDISSASSSTDESSSNSSTKWTPVEVADNDISCEGLVLTALNSGDFPEMVKATDSTVLDTIMDFSQYGITDYSVYQQAISVELSEVIAVRADNVDGVYDALMARKSSLIKQFGTYPEQEKVVSQTVVFKKGDLCVLIASDEPMTAERAILDKLKANTVSEG